MAESEKAVQENAAQELRQQITELELVAEQIGPRAQAELLWALIRPGTANPWEGACSEFTLVGHKLGEAERALSTHIAAAAFAGDLERFEAVMRDLPSQRAAYDQAHARVTTLEQRGADKVWLRFRAWPRQYKELLLNRGVRSLNCPSPDGVLTDAEIELLRDYHEAKAAEANARAQFDRNHAVVGDLIAGARPEFADLRTT